MPSQIPHRPYIGTSGWHYDHWIGPFYPAGMSREVMLEYYARYFDTVEINNSFYRLPEAGTFEHWRNTVPAGFTFSVKGSRYITHMKKLRDPANPLNTLMQHAGSLGGKLGPILFQMPPRWGKNVDRLMAFLDILPAGRRFAFEFRDPSWFDSDVYEALARRGAALCIYDLAGTESPREVTTDFTYVRLHGPGEAYSGYYSRDRLQSWASFLQENVERGRDAYCYFDNDQLGYAVQNALETKEFLGL